MSKPDPRLIAYVQTGSFGDVAVDDALYASAREHGLVQLLAEEVDAGGADVGRDLRNQLAVDQLAAQARVAKHLDAISEAVARLDGFAELGLAKGLAVSTQFYERQESRPASDVDIFFSPVDTQKLGKLVKRLNPSEKNADVLDAMVKEGRNFEHSVVIGGISFDVHRDINNLILPTSQAELFWEQTVEIELRPGLTVRTPDLERSLIVCLLGCARDCFADLLHVNDVRLMLDAEPDLVEIERFARAEGWYPLVSNALDIVCSILDRPNPLPPIDNPVSQKVFAAAFPQELILGGHYTRARTARRQTLISALVDQRRVALARTLARRVFPSKELIELRSSRRGGPYLVQLVKWRSDQRRVLRQRQLAHLSGE